MLRPFPKRLGGPIRDVSWDDKTWRARIGRAWTRGWRTEITVPASLGAFTASCGEVSGRTIVVDTDDVEAQIEVVAT